MPFFKIKCIKKKCNIKVHTRGFPCPAHACRNHPHLLAENQSFYCSKCLCTDCLKKERKPNTLGGTRCESCDKKYICKLPSCNYLNGGEGDYCFKHSCNGCTIGCTTTTKNFCDTCRCPYPDCDNEKFGTFFCRHHTCYHSPCENPKETLHNFCKMHQCKVCYRETYRSSQYCIRHKCKRIDCNQRSIAECWYCVRHICSISTCNAALYDTFTCSFHYQQSSASVLEKSETPEPVTTNLKLQLPRICRLIFNDNPVCSVCEKDITDIDDLIATNCNGDYHVYCKRCITQWTANKDTCPMCRTVIKT